MHPSCQCYGAMRCDDRASHAAAAPAAAAACSLHPGRATRKAKGGRGKFNNPKPGFFPPNPTPFCQPSPPHHHHPLACSPSPLPATLTAPPASRPTELCTAVHRRFPTTRQIKKKQPGGGGGKCAAAAATRPPIRSIYYCSYGRRGPSGRLGTAPTEQIAGVAVSDGTHAPRAARRRHSCRTGTTTTATSRRPSIESEEAKAQLPGTDRYADHHSRA